MLQMGGWKLSYGIREKRIAGEADDVPEMTISLWIERLPELIKGYKLKDILNMDELGLFFKALPKKGLVENAKENAKEGRMSSKG